MSNPARTIRITGEPQRRYAREVIDRIVTGGERVWEIVVRAEADDRTLSQNDKFHCLIADIWKQAFRGYSFDALKAVFVSQFSAAKDAMGEPLSHPGETTWDWKRKTPVYVRPSTTKFTKAETSEFIEFLYSEGSALDVNWSDKALAVYDEFREVSA